jgi:hypothetical protein
MILDLCSFTSLTERRGLGRDVVPQRRALEEPRTFEYLDLPSASRALLNLLPGEHGHDTHPLGLLA